MRKNELGIHLVKNFWPLGKLVCISTFGPHTHQFRKAILTNWHLLTGLECPMEKTIFAMKKNKSIGQQIIQADLRKSKNTDLRALWKLPPVEGHHKCGNCSVCNNTIEGNEFMYNSIKWIHKEFTNCKTKNIVCHNVPLPKTIHWQKNCSASLTDKPKSFNCTDGISLYRKGTF